MNRATSFVRSFSSAKPVSKYDAVIIGGGHNGLTAAAYLAKAGKKVCVLERRHILGGAAVTEEIIPGFKFSRASYVLSLLRPTVIEELKLKEHGLRYHLREPHSFTPIRNTKESLLLGSNMKENQVELARFSKKDAENYPRYEHMIARIAQAVEGLMDDEPVPMHKPFNKSLKEFYHLYKRVRGIGVENAVEFYELMTAPIAKVMEKWFENPALQATIATDGVIGFAASPYDLGTGYVLLHHVMGGLDGRTGTWGYVFGGMGAVSQAIASAARSAGAELYTEQEVSSILVEKGQARGVKLSSGMEIHADLVFSNCTPKVTFCDLLEESHLPIDYLHSIKQIDYTSPVTKINVALKELPNFVARPHHGSQAAPHHQTTIHMNGESMQLIHEGCNDYRQGKWSTHPVMEMTLPSSVDDTLVKGSGHVCLLFTQYTPYKPAEGPWTDEMKERYARHVFSEIDAYAPNFSSSIVGYEVLTPPTLEATFNLTGGNIFHGSMTLDQLYFARPVNKGANYSTPIKSLFLCGSGTHPGGGVTGAPGRLSALAALKKH
ncbi:unnamed protein product, partial [Mesorhabditis belari]|uniref:Amine oxidase domain-containing protein n=1 Tax=Mesorhabditis belari TaxID=2138241 RepID=A0AAF3FEE2_9BILA